MWQSVYDNPKGKNTISSKLQIPVYFFFNTENFPDAVKLSYLPYMEYCFNGWLLPKLLSVHPSPNQLLIWPHHFLENPGEELTFKMSELFSLNILVLILVFQFPLSNYSEDIKIQNWSTKEMVGSSTFLQHPKWLVNHALFYERPEIIVHDFMQKIGWLRYDWVYTY